MTIVGQDFGPAAELPLGAFHDKSALKTANGPLFRAGQKAGGRAEALPHLSCGKASSVGPTVCD
jgi:hypothetical protein